MNAINDNIGFGLVNLLLGLDVRPSFIVSVAFKGAFLLRMRWFFALISVVFALLLQADVAQASCANDGEQQVTFAVSARATSIASMIVHDNHVPCSDGTHLHISCVCAGQFFVPASVLVVPDFSYTIVRFELSRAMLIGRKLQPPVPPPL